MRSFWASNQSPLRWDSSQSPFRSSIKPALDIKQANPIAEEEIRRSLSAEKPIAEEEIFLSLSAEKSIAEEETFLSLSADNIMEKGNSDFYDLPSIRNPILSDLSDRLEELELRERIEAAEHRIRSLHLSQLSTKPSDDITGVISEMARSTRMMAQFQGKAAEKDSNENSKLVGLNTGDIIQFLSSFNRKSCQPVYYQVSVKTRKALALTLGVPVGTTLESFYG